MNFDCKLDYDRHLEYSAVHGLNMRLRELSQGIRGGPTVDPYGHSVSNILFTGQKLVNVLRGGTRCKTNGKCLKEVHFTILHHYNENCIELRGYDNSTLKEFNRLYFDFSLLVVNVRREEMRKCKLSHDVILKSAHTAPKETEPDASSNRGNSCLQTSTRMLLVEYVLERVHLMEKQSEGSQEVACKLAYLFQQTDTKRFDPVLLFAPLSVSCTASPATTTPRQYTVSKYRLFPSTTAH